MTIYTRQTTATGVTNLARPLTNAEGDGNFIDLQQNKLSVSETTSLNTPLKVVTRDASGNFSAGTITATLIGNATTATNISNSGTVTLASATESNSVYITAPTITLDQPVKLLNFDWYGNIFSLGNIRSGATPSNGFGIFYTPSGGSRVELLRIGTSGNVGIGTSSPTSLLQAEATSDAEISIACVNNSTGVSSIASLKLQGQGNNFSLRNYGDGTTSPNRTDFISTASSSYFTFSPSNTERVRIDSSGNLLVGITSTTAGERARIYSGANSRLRIDTSTDGIILGADGTGPFIDTYGTNRLGFFIQGTERARIDSSGNVGIGTTNPGYRLEVNGSFAATTKSFLIPHPTKSGMKLRYGSLEGPENGVYVRGKLEGYVIELPEYWAKLVDPDSITVQLTPIGKHQKLYVEDIKDNKIYIAVDGFFASAIKCFYYILAERVDVEKLQTEIE